MVCPKCGVQIKRFDLSPNCKNCGVHILYYTQEKSLSTDAKRTELEFASARAFTARLKAAFISGAAPISRMVFCILSIAALFLPIGSAIMKIPYFEMKINLGVLGIYSIFSDGIFGLVFDFIKSDIGGTVSTLALIALVSVLLCVLCVLACLLTLLLSFINIKKSAKAQCILSAAAALFMAAAEGFIIAASKTADATNVMSVTHCIWGALGAAAMFAAYFATNRAILKNPPEIKINDVDKKRIAIRADIKAGKISLDDLPVPVLETEEERLQRENALAGIPAKKKKSKKKGDEE